MIDNTCFAMNEIEKYILLIAKLNLLQILNYMSLRKGILD